MTLLKTVKEKWKMEHLSNLDWDKTYIRIAELLAQHSKANRRKVGTVLVKYNQIISYGYNGTAPNMDNACENSNGEKTQKETIVELAAKGKTIDQIVELTGFIKTNVSWYFSRLQLGGKKKVKK